MGRSIAQRLAEDGFAVVVSFASHAHEAKETVAEITDSGGQATAIQADVTQEEMCGGSLTALSSSMAGST